MKARIELVFEFRQPRPDEVARWDEVVAQGEMSADVANLPLFVDEGDVEHLGWVSGDLPFWLRWLVAGLPDGITITGAELVRSWPVPNGPLARRTDMPPEDTARDDAFAHQLATRRLRQLFFEEAPARGFDVCRVTFTRHSLQLICHYSGK